MVSKKGSQMMQLLKVTEDAVAEGLQKMQLLKKGLQKMQLLKRELQKTVHMMLMQHKRYIMIPKRRIGILGLHRLCRNTVRACLNCTGIQNRQPEWLEMLQKD